MKEPPKSPDLGYKRSLTVVRRAYKRGISIHCGRKRRTSLQQRSILRRSAVPGLSRVPGLSTVSGATRLGGGIWGYLLFPEQAIRTEMGTHAVGRADHLGPHSDPDCSGAFARRYVCP